MKITDLLRVQLSNTLYWLTIGVFKIVRLFFGKLCLVANKLNYDENLYQSKLKILGLSPKEVIEYKKLKLPFCSVEQFINFNSRLNSIKFFSRNKKTKLSPPNFVDNNLKLNTKSDIEVLLPDFYLSELHNINLFGGSHLIRVEDRIIYDEIALHDNINKSYKIRSPNVVSIGRKSLVIKSCLEIKSINQGIHLLQEHSKNYYHFIIENLPRIMLTEDIDSEVPLLIDNNLPKQFYEVLSIFNDKKRKIIEVDFAYEYRVKKLFYPSPMSFMRDNYRLKVDSDCVYSKESIEFIRSKVYNHYGISEDQKAFRKLYISRQNSSYRKILNETEIQDILVSNGFEIVFLENLSFFAQVKLFSEAKIIIGQSGAGMTNILFANKTCNILSISINLIQTLNFYSLSMIGKILGINLRFLLSDNFSNSNNVHSDFIVDKKDILKYLNNFLQS